MSSSFIKTFNILSELRPYDINIGKIRIGGERDGGYILADIPSQSDVVSFGVGPDVTFEHHLAELGRRIFLYDHTVDSTPTTHRNFNFVRKGICGSNTRDPDLLPLHDHISNINELSSCSILKVDVEGYEWEMFSTISQDDLKYFDHIVIEMHWFERLDDPFFASKVHSALINLNKQFVLFHVHPNNYASLHFVNGFPVASVIEVSYIRKSLVEISESKTIYPSTINKSNHPNFRDYILLFYPFIPLGVSNEQVLKVTERVDAGLNLPTGGLRSNRLNIARGRQYQTSSKFASVETHPFTDGPTGDVRFHTEIETSPWLLFKFEKAVPISAVFIHNRDELCQDRARSIAVSVSADGKHYVTVYAPELYVTPGSGASALGISINYNEPVRFVKFFLRERTYFHLQCIEIWVDEAFIN